MEAVIDRRTRRYTPDSAPRKPFAIKKMWDRHHEIARRLVLGEKPTDIAKDLGITKETVSNTRNSPIVRDHISVLQAARDVECIDVAQEIKATAPKALKLLQDILEPDTDIGQSASPALKAHTARDLLDRAGHAPVRKFSGEIAHGLFTAADVAELKARTKR